MSRIYLIPVVVFVLFQSTFICTYIAAVIQGHVVPDIPYISDAATYSPESCIFGQLINIGSVLLGITIYIRYRQILQLISHHPEIGESVVKYNKIAVYFGLISCLGISIVANFQETNVRIVHFTGAFFAFGVGTLYFWMQAFISYLVHPFAGSLLKAHIRLGMAIICTVLFFVIAVTGIISHILFQGKDPRKWRPSDGGWKYHVVSSISEWVVATVFSFSILTFTDEFRDIHFDHPPITLINYAADEINVLEQ